MPVADSVQIGGKDATTGMQLRRAVVEEGLGRVTRTTVEFLSKDRALPLKKLIGSKIRLVTELADDAVRKLTGLCVAAEYKGMHAGSARYLMEVRPWLWLLTRRRDCRVFQGKSVPDLIKDIVGDYGFSANLQNRLTGTYSPREFCLQYRETDFDFLSRLMEEEGIYYFFSYENDTETLVLADAISAHRAMPAGASLEFAESYGSFDRGKEHVYEVAATEILTLGKITLNDFNFEKPGLSLLQASAIPKGDHRENDHEAYESPGRYRDADTGKRRTQVRMEAEAARHLGWDCSANIRVMAAGQTFTMKGHPQTQGEQDFLITRAVHYHQVDPTEDSLGPDLADGISFEENNRDQYRCAFRMIPKSVPYRTPLDTPWPEIPGIQTAMVVGRSGEEIDTDEFGRVRIQFHWDRTGKKDEKSSVWVRTMMPWTGKGWGMIAVPRIGQEVVVQFEEGDPDRPVIVGMLYNADAKPPWALPTNKTQSGVKTNSSKTGGGFNELMMEDKKGSELVRFQAEKDYLQIVKNNADVKIGEKDKGDMTVTVNRHLSETIKTGDHTFKIETGNQSIEIEKNKTEVIKKGNVETTVETGNVVTAVDTGNVSETIKKGSVTREIKLGNETTTLSAGNVKVDVKLGKIEMSAMQEISLTVGGSSVVINQAGVTIKGSIIKIEGNGMVNVKAPMTNVNADAMLVLKGSITMIN